MGISMKKFLSIILSLSILCGQTTATFAQEASNTINQEEQKYLELNGMLPFMWDGAKKFYDGTSGMVKKIADKI